MAYIHPLQPQATTVADTTAGGVYCTSIFHAGMAVGQVDFTNGSTGKVIFMLQGRNGTAGPWFDMKAAASTVSSGASARVTSTYGLIFDRLRIETTAASETTKTSNSFVFVLSAR
jgi:predicted ATPase